MNSRILDVVRDAEKITREDHNAEFESETKRDESGGLHTASTCS